jgi:YHS domain-containing protein
MSEISRRSFIVGAVAAASVGGAAAQSGPAGAKRVALKGYDPMSYFTEGKPEKGTGEFSFAFDDATYWFKSAEHKTKFAADPERYAPQFDGYCAMQLSRGYKVEADPEAWTITNGKLYVFAGKPAVPKFAKESVAVVEKAKENWPQVIRQPAISLSEALHR